MASGIKCSVYDSQFKGKTGLGEEMAEKNGLQDEFKHRRNPKMRIYV
jgi:hypothetical protein